MEPKDLEQVKYEAECPTCKKVVRPFLVEHKPSVLHIPPRDVLLCPECKTPWYMPLYSVKLDENAN